MAKQRYLNTHFWDDSYIVTLDPSEKLLFCYLILNPLASLAGLYEISLRRIGFDTGFDQDTVKRLLGRFEQDKKLSYKLGWVCMINHPRHVSTNPSILKGINREIELTPAEVLETVPTEWVQAVYRLYTESDIPKPKLKPILEPKPIPNGIGFDEPPSDKPLPSSFEIFWVNYPKKVSKKKASQIWKNKNLDKYLAEILQFISKAVNTDQWKGGFIPHPTTFLNQERWNDDLSAYGRGSNQGGFKKGSTAEIS